MSLTPCIITHIPTKKVVSVEEALDLVWNDTGLRGKALDLIAGTEKKEAPKPTAEKKLGDAFAKWKAAQNKQGIAFDPKSQAEADIEFLKAIAEYIKDKVSQGAYAFKQFVTDMKDNGVEGVDEFKDDWKDFFDSNVPPPMGEKTERGEGEPVMRKSRLAQRAVEGESTDEFVDAMEELGYLYEVESSAKAAAKVKELFEQYGPEEILDGIRKGLIDGAAASRAWVKVLDIVNQEFLNAKTEEEAAEALERHSTLLRELSFMATKKGQFGSGLYDAYLESDFKFDVASMTNALKDAAGGTISKEMQNKIKEWGTQIADLTKRLADVEAEKKALEERQILDNYTESEERQKPTDNRPQAIKDAAKAAANRVRKLKVARPEYINAASPAVIAWDAAVEIVATSIEASGNVAQAIDKGLKVLRESDWYKSVSKDIQKRVEADFVTQNTDSATPEPEYIDGKVKVTRGAIAALVRQGYDTIDKVVDKVAEMLNQPNLTKRQIRDAITGYGKTINPTKDEVQLKIQEITRIGQKISQIEDARKKIRPLRSGKQRVALVAEERRLQKELNQLLKELPQTDVDLSKAIKTALDGIKTRLTNQIEDLNKQIEKKERLIKTKTGTPYDAEAAALKAQRDELAQALNDLVGKQGISDEQRIKAAIEAVEKSLAEYQRRIDEKDFSTADKPKGPESEELKKLRAERDKIKEEYEALKKGPPKTEEQLKLDRLQKELDSILQGEVKDQKDRTEDSPAVKALKEQIIKAKQEAGLIAAKRTQDEIAIEKAENEIKELDRRINELDFSAKQKNEKIESEELKAVRSLKEEKRKKLADLKKQAFPPKTEEERRVERLQNQLDELLQGIIPEESNRIKKEDSPIVKKLKDAIAAQKAAMGLTPSRATDDQKSYEAALRAAKKRLADLEERIEKNNLQLGRKISQQFGPELDAARKRANAAQDLLDKLRKEAGVFEQQKLDAWKKAAQKSIDNYKERLKKGDFSTKPRSEAAKLDAEAKDLLSKKIRVKEQYMKALAQYKQDQQSLYAHTVSTVASVLRLIVTTGEWSFLTIQNGMIASGILLRDPAKLRDAFKNTFKAMGNPEFSEKLVEDVKSQEWYPEMKASGLSIIDDFTAESQKDETAHLSAAQSFWNKLEYLVRPIAFGDLPSKTKEDIAHDIFQKGNAFEAFERAANAFGNAMRVAEFLRGRQILLDKGITFEDNPKAYKELAAGINTMSARTSLGSAEAIVKYLNLSLFSARNWASVLKNLPPIAIFYYGAKGEGAKKKIVTTPELKFNFRGKDYGFPSKTFEVQAEASPIQKMYLQNFMSYVALTGSVVGSFMLYQALNEGDDDEEKEKYKGPKVERDPRSAGFAKVKFGNQYYDPWGGRQQQIVLFSRLIADILIDMGVPLEGSYKSLMSGQVSKLGDSGFVPSKGELVQNMIRNKLSPAAGLVYDWAYSALDEKSGERVLNGRQIDLQEQLYQSFKPMYWQTVAETAQEQPALTMAFLDVMGFMGHSVNVIKPTPLTQAQQITEDFSPGTADQKKARKRLLNYLEIGDMEKARKEVAKAGDTWAVAESIMTDRSKAGIPNSNEYAILKVAQGKEKDATIYLADGTETTVKKFYKGRPEALANLLIKYKAQEARQRKQLRLLNQIKPKGDNTDYLNEYFSSKLND